MTDEAPRRSSIATLPYRILLEISSLVAARPKLWTSTARKLVGGVIFVALVDLNSTHVRDFVRELVAAWRTVQTQAKMGAIGAALDAEYASYSRYTPVADFEAFVRTWVEGHGEDPVADSWGAPIALELDGVRYRLRSSGPDGICDTADDVVYAGGP